MNAALPSLPRFLPQLAACSRAWRPGKGKKGSSCLLPIHLSPSRQGRNGLPDDRRLTAIVKLAHLLACLLALFEINGLVQAVTLEPPSRNFPRAGGGGAIILTAGPSEAWTATTDVNWIRITPTTSGTGPGTVVYLVNANNTADLRIGSITIGGQIHRVNQEGYDSVVAPTSATFDLDGGAGTITVTVQAGISWTARSTEDWIKLTSPSAAASSGSVNFEVAPYTGVAARSGTMLVAGKTVAITQTGRDVALTPGSSRLSDESDIVLFGVSALATTSWKVQPEVDWISVVDAGTGKGDSSVAIAVTANLSYAKRTGVVRVGTAAFTVTQAGVPIPQLSVAPPLATAISAGAFGLVNVSATPDAPWTATSSDGWLTITEGKTGSGSAPVRYVVSANPGTASRTATITVVPKPQEPSADLQRGLIGHFAFPGMARMFKVQMWQRSPHDRAELAAGNNGGQLAALETLVEREIAVRILGGNSAWIQGGSWQAWRFISPGGLIGTSGGNLDHFLMQTIASDDLSGLGSNLDRKVLGRGRNGGVDNALVFDNSMASRVSALARRGDALSFSFWFNPTYSQRVNRLMEVDSSNRVAGLFAGEDDRLTFVMVRSNSPIESLVTDYTLRVGVWQHLIATVDESRRVALFINGKNVGEQLFSDSPVAVEGGRVSFGQMNLPSPGFFTGAIDDIRFYNRALSSEEITLVADLEASGRHLDFYNLESLNNEAFNSQSLMFHLGCDGNGLDQTGQGFTAQLSGFIRSATDRDVRPDAALDLAGGGEYLQVSGAASYQTNYKSTICCWIRLDSLRSGKLLSRVDRTSRYPVTLSVNVESSNQVKVVVANESLSTTEELVIEKAIEAGQWYFFSSVSDGNDVAIYLASHLVGKRRFGGVPDPRMFDRLTFGGFDGQIDDIRLFDRILTQAEIAEMYELERPKTSVHTVVQNATVGSLATTSATMPAQGGSGQVRLTIDGVASWSAQSEASWINITAGANGAGSGNVAFSVAPNPSVYERVGYLTIAGLEFIVRQSGWTVLLDKDTFTLGPDGGSAIVALNTEASAKWNAAPAEDWIIVAEGQSGLGPGAIILVVSPFASPSGSRRGSVAIAGKQILVNQMGYEASVDPLVSEISSKGGTNEVNVRVPLGAIWEAIARAPWITLIGEQTRNGSGSITFVTSPNSGAPRSGTIVIAGREVTVLQSAASEGDTDADDLPDAWENEHFGSLVQDGAGDADQDGFSNLIEFKVGTRPNDKASKPDTTVSIWPAVEIGFPTMKELRYQLQGSDDLQTWINLKELIPGTGAPVSTFERVQDGRMKFYRVVVK